MCAALFSLRTNTVQFPMSLSSGLRLSPDLALASALHACCAASQEVKEKQYQADNQGHVNEGGGHAKCEESKQPKNNQNCSDYPKHVFHLLVSERDGTSDLVLANWGDAYSCAGEQSTGRTLVAKQTSVCPVVHTSTF